MTTDISVAARKRIAAASDPAIRYEGTIYEGGKLRKDEWVTLRLADFNLLAKVAGL